MKYTIKDLAEGRCAVINDGTLEDLTEVLRKAFSDGPNPLGLDYYYFKSNRFKNNWACVKNKNDLGFLIEKTQSVKDFLEEPKQHQYTMESLILQLQERAYEQGLKVEIIFKTK